MSKISIFIPGPMPGRNEQEAAARSHFHAAASMKKKWTNHCAECFKGAPRFDRVDLECLWVEPNKRRDPDNISGAIKFVLDGMIKAGVIKNDGWKQVRNISHRCEKGDKPGLYITVRGV